MSYRNAGEPIPPMIKVGDLQKDARFREAVLGLIGVKTSPKSGVGNGVVNVEFNDGPTVMCWSAHVTPINDKGACDDHKKSCV